MREGETNIKTKNRHLYYTDSKKDIQTSLKRQYLTIRQKVRRKEREKKGKKKR